MAQVSITTAALVMGVSARTIWRRISDGSMASQTEQGSTTVSLAEVLAGACIKMEDEDVELIQEMDRGSAEAQCDAGLMFLMEGREQSAIQLFELAAKQRYPEAMYWLARSYVAGTGVEQSEDTGVMWLAKAAEAGHQIAKRQMIALREKGAPRGGLDAMLEAIDKATVLAALKETSS